MGDFYGFLLCLITILGFLGLKGWKYWLLALAMAHGCSDPAPFHRFCWVLNEPVGSGTQVPRSIGWYLSSSEEFPVVGCHRTLWDGHGSGIAFIIGIHRMCTHKLATWMADGEQEWSLWVHSTAIAATFEPYRGNFTYANLWPIFDATVGYQKLGGYVITKAKLLWDHRSFVKQLILHPTTTKRHIVIGYLCIYFIYFPSI